MSIHPNCIPMCFNFLVTLMCMYCVSFPVFVVGLSVNLPCVFMSQVSPPVVFPVRLLLVLVQFLFLFDLCVISHNKGSLSVHFDPASYSLAFGFTLQHTSHLAITSMFQVFGGFSFPIA